MWRTCLFPFRTLGSCTIATLELPVADSAFVPKKSICNLSSLLGTEYARVVSLGSDRVVLVVLVDAE